MVFVDKVGMLIHLDLREDEFQTPKVASGDFFTANNRLYATSGIYTCCFFVQYNSISAKFFPEYLK